MVLFLGAGNVNNEACDWQIMAGWMRAFSVIAVFIIPCSMWAIHYGVKCTKSRSCWKRREKILLGAPILMLLLCAHGVSKTGDGGMDDIQAEDCTEDTSSGVHPVAALYTISMILLVFFGCWLFVACLASMSDDDKSAVAVLTKPRMNFFSQNLRCVPAEELDGNTDQGHVTTLKHLQALRVDRKLDAEISIENLEDALNENLLWHGTTKEASELIVHDDFRIPQGSQVTHGRRFGVGAYFAEDLDKSMSYARNENGTKFILLCRVTCGQFYYTEASSETQAHDTAAKNSKNCVLANPGKVGPREFIVLSADQVYPEFILEVSTTEVADDQNV